MTTEVAQGERIRIEDLGAPILNELQKNALRQAEAVPVAFSEEAILSAARAQTGLDDFGDPSFLPRLRIWVGAASKDVGLSAVGRAVLWGEMVRFAATRLLVEAKHRAHPEITNMSITTPIVVAGLPRSGTTYLLQLLASDRNMRSLPTGGDPTRGRPLR